MNFSYYNPVYIDFGLAALNNLSKHLATRKALLVTSKGFVKRGIVEKIKKANSSIVHVVSQIEPNPEVQHLKEIYESIASIDFEIIIALGGGSVIDSAKVFSLYNEDKSFEFVDDILRGKIEKKSYSLYPIIAIPTTAGTGSELTPWATVWDMTEKKKYSLHLPELFPEIAICDPNLTLTVPKDITIQTGLDALSHSLESIWNKNTNVISQIFAIQASKIIIANLALLANDLSNIELRAKLMLACVNAGKAFSNTATATAHAMSYFITAHKGIPHGIACSFSLPKIVSSLIGEYKWLDTIFLDIFGELSEKVLNDLFSQLDISTDISDYGISEEELQIIKRSLATNTRAANGIVDIDELFSRLKT